jgi:hypothetical protein
MDNETTGVAPTEQASTPAANGGMNSPYCREIRSKKYYFLQEMPTEEHHLSNGSTPCWCQRTMQVVGPDGEIVRPRDCTAGRSCYRSLFDEGV